MDVQIYKKIETLLGAPAGKPPGVSEARVRFVTLEEAKRPKPSIVSEEERERAWREIRELGEALRHAPRVSDLSDDEILGYDEEP